MAILVPSDGGREANATGTLAGGVDGTGEGPES